MADPPALPPAPDAWPRGLRSIGWGGLVAALKRIVIEFRRDNLEIWAAALTYYGVLSIFPGLLILVAALGMLDDSLVKSLQDNMGKILPADVSEMFATVVNTVQASDIRPGVAAAAGLLIAFWSSSAYINAFVKACNNIYDVPEGRPVWKIVPVRLLLTLTVGILIIVSIVIVVLGRGIAPALGELLGIGDSTVQVWLVVKWPLLAVLASLILAILYWVAPNARLGSFRLLRPGSIVAIVLWIIISSGFATYVANFSSYDQTYGTVTSAIVFLLWLWLTNLALLLGVEVDAELARERAVAAGHPVADEPYLQLRDSRKVARHKTTAGSAQRS